MDTLLPALSKNEYDTLESYARGNFSSVGAYGYPMTTIYLPYEEPYCVPAQQYQYMDSAELGLLH